MAGAVWSLGTRFEGLKGFSCRTMDGDGAGDKSR